MLYVRDLVNVLIGEDWAVLDLSRMASAELGGLERLLARIESADVQFVREGREYSGTDPLQFREGSGREAGAGAKSTGPMRRAGRRRRMSG